MDRKLEIHKIANVMEPDRGRAVFCGLMEVETVGGEERRHLLADPTFDTEEEARNWFAEWERKTSQNKD